MFWSANALLLVLEFDGEQAPIQSIILHFGSIIALALVGATTLWGLRQRPPLMPDIDPAQSPASPEDGVSEHIVGKYEKSALNAEISSRIAGKLRNAMERDHLHRDPNLSLWALSRHIGASPNYVSQTLNEIIGESFFDFVNRYRIEEAMNRLEATDDNVLTITYDVGFNARSSFYNAFKRVTGQTPTSYRKNIVSP